MKIKNLTPLLLALALTACGSTNTESKKEEPKEETKVEETTEEETTEEKPTEEVKSDVENGDFYNSYNIGKKVKADGFGEVEVVKAGGDIDNLYKVGDLDFSITAVALVHVKPNTEQGRDYWGDEKDMIFIGYKVTNNSDQQLNLYPTQRKIVTNTQEQLSPDIFASNGDGEYLGNVKEEGFIVYYPESDLKDINEITYYLEKACDKDFNPIGEDHQIKITFDENGKLKSIK